MGIRRLRIGEELFRVLLRNGEMWDSWRRLSVGGVFDELPGDLRLVSVRGEADGGLHRGGVRDVKSHIEWLDAEHKRKADIKERGIGLIELVWESSEWEGDEVVTPEFKVEDVDEMSMPYAGVTDA